MTDKLRSFTSSPSTTLIAVLLTALVSIISTGAMSYAAFWKNSDTRTERVEADERIVGKVDLLEDKVTIALTKMQDTMTEFRIETRADLAALKKVMDSK